MALLINRAFRGSSPGPSAGRLPGPRGNPFLGTAVRLRRDLLGTLLRDRDRYGDLVAYPVGPAGPLRQTLVVAHHPDDVQRVLAQTERTLSKDTVGFRAMADLLGRGLLTTEGEEWRRQRRIVQPLFTPRRVEGYAGLMAEEAARIAAAPGAGPVARGGPVTGSEPVDVHLLMLRYTLRVVGRALFGDTIEDLVPVLHDLVPAVSDATLRRTFQLVHAPMDWPTPRNIRPRRLRAQEYAVVDEILSRSPAPVDAAEGRDDLVTRLRTARDPETGDALSEAEIRDQALIFLMAGHETTAGALTFTLHLLGRHPHEQDRVADEVAAVLGDRPAPGPADLPRLRRTRAALLEGMRLYPSAHITERVTRESLTVAGHELPAGTVVAVSPWSTQRHPGFWPAPDGFDPDRFLDEEAAATRPRYAYFPFGGGPRSCVGEHFAVLEAVILLAAFLRRHRVTSLSNRLDIVPMITLRPRGVVPVLLTDR